MSDNWVVQNLQNALDTWNSKLSEIWQLLTTSPQEFKGGSIWNVMVTINGAVQAIGLALLVLFFVVGVVRTCGSFTEVKKPEHALKLFIRFAIAKGVITYGLELMLALFNIVQGTISTIMTSAGFGTPNQTKSGMGKLRRISGLPSSSLMPSQPAASSAPACATRSSPSAAASPSWRNQALRSNPPIT